MIRIEEMSSRFGIRSQVKWLIAGIKKGVVTAALNRPRARFWRGGRPLSSESSGREGRDACMTRAPQIGESGRKTRRWVDATKRVTFGVVRRFADRMGAETWVVRRRRRATRPHGNCANCP